MFASRLPGRLEPNTFSRALTAAAAEGRTLIDLTVTNPTRAGIRHAPGVFRPLAGPLVDRYDPEPFGLKSAREAVAADYLRRGLIVAADRIALTSSTSEAYSLLFKLLCAPEGDDVLVPRPSYPLFDHLTALDGVTARPYYLEYHGRWQLDVASVDEVWDGRTRALLAVSPNNPTGSRLSAAELAALDARAAGRDAAIILDEVFADYLFGSGDVDGAVCESAAPQALTFRLGGLSKSAALPQVKLGWIAVDGPASLVAGAIERLEIICDTYLSVSTPVQVAAPDLIASGAEARRRVLERVRLNQEHLRLAAGRHPSVQVLDGDGGWSAVLRVPSRGTEEEIVLDLLARDSVVVHPGYFFDFPHEAFLVISLLPEPSLFAEGVDRVLERVSA
jgi:aspartate/methionine/tyrosine aminotransferase